LTYNQAMQILYLAFLPTTVIISFATQFKVIYNQPTCRSHNC